MSRCRSCNAEIEWAHTETSKLAPFEADPDGLWVITDGEARRAGLFDDGTERYTSHFASCPDAGEWRRGIVQ